MYFVGFLGSKLFKREALGGGDIKLSFVIGMSVGMSHGFLVLILSTFLALPYATFSLFSKTSREVPFGPFLISALCIVFLYYDKFTYIIKLLSYTSI
jgi:prepilin signal peptidase PulO-like enzyme (type II secretory pathway)